MSHLLGIGDQDQSSFMEAHTYQPLIERMVMMNRPEGENSRDWRWHRTKYGCFPSPYYYNGYRLGERRVFLDTTPQRGRSIFGYTEETHFSPMWRMQAASAMIDEERYNAVIPEQGDNFGGDLERYYESDVPLLARRDKSFWNTRSCSAYRVANFPTRYGDLTTVAGVLGGAGSPLLEDLCYEGGWDLYPLTGEMLGSYSEHVTAGCVNAPSY